MAENTTGSKYIDALPEARRSDITNRMKDFKNFSKAVDKGNYGAAEKEFMETFYVWEDGTKLASNGAYAGIFRDESFYDLRSPVPVLKKTALPKDLTVEQISVYYHVLLDEKLKWAGGAEALEKIGDTDVAVFVADTLFRGRRCLDQKNSIWH